MPLYFAGILFTGVWNDMGGNAGLLYFISPIFPVRVKKQSNRRKNGLSRRVLVSG
jgi:hypothetical protein